MTSAHVSRERPDRRAPSYGEAMGGPSHPASPGERDTDQLDSETVEPGSWASPPLTFSLLTAPEVGTASLGCPPPEKRALRRLLCCYLPATLRDTGAAKAPREGDRHRPTRSRAWGDRAPSLCTFPGCEGSLLPRGAAHHPQCKPWEQRGTAGCVSRPQGSPGVQEVL